MQKRPYAFDALFTNMVAAGEAGGILDTILKRLSTFIEKQAKLRVAGPVGDDLSDRRPQHRGHRRHGHHVEGRPDVHRRCSRA